jgi:hypothetical protein
VQVVCLLYVGALLLLALTRQVGSTPVETGTEQYGKKDVRAALAGLLRLKTVELQALRRQHRISTCVLLRIQLHLLT